MKREISEQLKEMLQEKEIIISDPKKEYEELINQLIANYGGKVIQLDPSSSTYFNPLDCNDGFINPFNADETLERIRLGGFENYYEFLELILKLQEHNVEKYKTWWLNDGSKSGALKILNLKNERTIMNMNEIDENKNSIVFGQSGRGVKIVTFKKENFNPELAPVNAKIEYQEDNEGNEIVIMTY